MNILCKILVPKKFKAKYSILELLNSQIDTGITQYKLSQIEVALKIYDKKFLYDQLYVLDKNKDITFLSTGEDPSFMITTDGRKSFIDDEYSKKGKKERLEFIYDIVKILAALTVLITFFRTVFLEYQNKTAIEELSIKFVQQEKKVKALELLNIHLQENKSMQPKLNKMNTQEGK
jgi:hypothetical protein